MSDPELDKFYADLIAKGNIARVVELATSYDEERRLGALRVLAGLNPAELPEKMVNTFYPAISKALDHGSEEFIPAVKILGKIGKASGIHSIFSRLNKDEELSLRSNWDVQRAVCEACRQIGEPAIDELNKFPDNDIAIESMREIGGQKAYDALISALKHNIYKGYILFSRVKLILRCIKTIGIAVKQKDLQHLQFTITAAEKEKIRITNRPTSFPLQYDPTEPLRELIQIAEELVQTAETDAQ